MARFPSIDETGTFEALEVREGIKGLTASDISAVQTRLSQVETMAGLEPGEVTDAQTANLVTREDTSTRTALEEVLVAELEAEHSASRAAVDRAIDDRAEDIASLATPQLDYVSTLATMAGYNAMTVTKNNEAGGLDVTCSTPGGDSVTYSLTNASRYQHAAVVRVTDPSKVGEPVETAAYRSTDFTLTNFEWLGATATPYTYQVGSVWTQEITIESPPAPILFRHYHDPRGGIWRISVDDTDLSIDFSTWSPTTGSRTQPLFTLTDPGTYTIRGEFIGDDPDNPPTNPGYSRGWTYSLLGAGVTESLVIEESGPLETRVSPSSNKDFALRIKKAGTEGDTEYVPYHGTESESFASPTRYYNAGTPLDIDSMSVGETVAVESFEWIQHIYGRNSNTGDENLIEIWTNQKIDSRGVFSVTGRWKTLTDIEAGSYLYHLMLMGSLPLFDEAVSGLGGTYTLDPAQAPDAIWTDEGNRTDGWALLSSTTDIAAAVRYDNRSETMRTGEDHTPAANRQTFIELRSGGGMAKVYPITFAIGTIIPAGRSHRFSGAYFYGVAPGAKGALSLE